MNKKVHIHHPVTGGDADVFESSLPHHRAAGWVVVGPASGPVRKHPMTEAGGDDKGGAPPSAPDQDTPAGEHAETAPTTTAADRPRRKSKE